LLSVGDQPVNPFFKMAPNFCVPSEISRLIQELGNACDRLAVLVGPENNNKKFFLSFFHARGRFLKE
jgi:hypothetical protein